MEITRVREICYTKAREFGFRLYCPIEVNTRFSRTLGRVSWNEFGELEKIEFSSTMLKTGTEEAIIATILHELAHAFVFLETGEIHGHDKVFREMCKRLGTIEDRATSKYFNGADEPVEHKYSIYCSCCGKLVANRSRACQLTKTPENYLSNCCKASLRVEQNY